MSTPIYDEIHREWNEVKAAAASAARIKTLQEMLLMLAAVSRPNAQVRNVIHYAEQQLKAAQRG